MNSRINRVTTRTGDDASSSDAEGTRQPKHAPRMQLLGDLDELNCHLGLLRNIPLNKNEDAMLKQLQNQLFELGAETAQPGAWRLSAEHVLWLEQHIHARNQRLPALTEFVLPGGPNGAAPCHLARAVCRRAERSASLLHQHAPLNPHALAYLNRLSDLLFVLARTLHQQTSPEAQWQATPKPG